MRRNSLVLGIFFIILICIIVICILKNPESQNNKTKIVTSFYPMYITALNLLDGIEDVELKNLTSNATGCVHDYTLTPQEMMDLSDAKCIIINGSGMEHFLEDIINNYANLIVIDSSIDINALKEEKHGINPHTFVSIENYIKQVNNVYNGLVKILPEHIAILEKNKEKYINELNQLKEYGNSKFNNMQNINIVALHSSFEYFAKDFGLNIIAVIEEEEGVSSSATSIAEIINKININDVKIIIVEKDSAVNTAQAIARETKASIVQVNLALTGQEVKDAYITAYKTNIDNIAKAISEGN